MRLATAAATCAGVKPSRQFGRRRRRGKQVEARHGLNHELAESKNFLDLGLPISGLYLLAAPSTPDEARDEIIIQRAAGGEKVATAQVKATIAKAKSGEPPAKPAEPQDQADGGPFDCAAADESAGSARGLDHQRGKYAQAGHGGQRRAGERHRGS